MNTINSSSLFHFTKEISTLKSIIKNGLRFSYNYEPFVKEVATQGLLYSSEGEEDPISGVGIPMVCFCDMPLMRTDKHVYRYGKYMIGFDKEKLTEELDNDKDVINPVLYEKSKALSDMPIELSIFKNDCITKIYNPDVIAKFQKTTNESDLSLSKLLKSSVIENELSQERYLIYAINNIIGFTKPYNNTKECFYDEREWRVIKQDNEKRETQWIWFSSKEKFDKGKGFLDDQIQKEKEGHIVFDKEKVASIITHIVVKKDSEIGTMIKYLRNSKIIFGNENISEENRLLLISKVTSFERIRKDY